jgi:hypothetical protein
MISDEHKLRQERHILTVAFLCRLYEALIPWGFIFYKDIASTALPKN